MASRFSIPLSLFVEHFRSAWEGRRAIAPYVRGQRKDEPAQLPPRLGLAVSGGADSMALAYLCRQLEVAQYDLSDAISVTAFIIDHQARVESSHEAHTVAGWLAEMGISTKILKLDWSSFKKAPLPLLQRAENTSFSIPSAFETHARRLRYQALGTACRDMGIDALLMGHHQDDSVETTIWRLANGAKLPGLGGIPQIARIPECHGLFGVSESGGSLRLLSERSNASLDAYSDNSASSPMGLSSVSSKSLLATGGIFLCRPLLDFPKARLLATCHENDVPYVSDPTNFDPTLTPRNAIRSLLTSSSLPRALQAPRILSLIRSSQTLLQEMTLLSNQLLQTRCQILHFNPKSGTLILNVKQRCLEVPSSPSNSADQIRQVQSLTLRRITELVSPFPDNHFSLRSFESFVARIFQENQKNGHETRKTFTLGGVMFQPLRSNQPSTSTGGCVEQSERNSMWMLSRQPFMKKRAPVTHLEVSIPNASHHTRDSSHPSSFSSWVLWDDRHWLRLSITPSQHHPHTSNLPSEVTEFRFLIRPFNQSDIQDVRKGLEISSGRSTVLISHLRKLLSVEAPGSTRFTLPVLVWEGIEDSNEPAELGISHLLALPTLDLAFSNHGLTMTGNNETYLIWGNFAWKLSWEWMYKMVDTEALHLMGCY